MYLAELAELTKSFGGLLAVDGLNLEVGQGEIVGLIGPNGAGKSTVFNLITGFLKPSAGKVMFQGEDITGYGPHRIAAKGIVRTFQQTTLFREMTVFQNIVLGRYLSFGASLVQDMMGSSVAKQAHRETQERASAILEFMEIVNLKDELAKNLPHGYQRVLGLAIAMAANPKLLLLDEPVTGMNAEESRHMVEQIGRIKEMGTTIVLVEHDMKVVMGVCERIVVLNFGKKIAEGAPKEIRRDKDVIAAYLGAEYAH
jgi:branched-chain amino acid transport system ATP-binding protein